MDIHMIGNGVLLPIIVAVKPQTLYFEPPKTLGSEAFGASAAVNVADIVWQYKTEWTSPIIAVEYRSDNPHRCFVVQPIAKTKDFDVILIHRGLPGSYNIDKLMDSLLLSGDILGYWQNLEECEADTSKLAKDVIKEWPKDADDSNKKTWLCPESAGKAELAKVKAVIASKEMVK